MSQLVWKPQAAFADYFLTDANEIIKHRSVFNPKYEYFVSFGGRGSAKTWTFIDAIVIEAALRPIRILVTRELQNSIEESVKGEIEEAIVKRDLQGFFNIKKQDITAVNGSKFIFKGLKNNINSLKSISNVELVLCEEAEGISKNSWDKLLPSIRPKSGKPPIVAVIFNPDDELDDTYQRFVVTPPKKTISRLINWRDNKYFPEHLNQQRLHCKATRPLKEYENIWEGKPKGGDDNVIIDRDWIRAARFATKKEGFVHVGPKIVGYDPAGQGRDENAVLFADGNIVTYADEWPKSPDLREATRRAMGVAIDKGARIFRYDECGGFGDGVAVFVDDIIEGVDQKLTIDQEIEILPFNAGDKVVDPEEAIEGTEKTNEEMYANLKAQAHGVTAQLLYNTFRFVVLGEKVEPEDMISINIEDDDKFNKLVKELSSPLWVKSGVNSKKKVESKKDMEKRTDQPSPNMADAFHMLWAPVQRESKGFFDVFLE